MRVVTALLVVAVAAIAGAAVVDAVRSSAASPEDRRSALIDELRAAGVHGRLAYTAADCSFRVRTLPDFRPLRSPRRFEGSACPFGTPTASDGPPEDVGLTRTDLERAAVRHPVMPDDLRYLRSVVVTDAARLVGERVASLLEIRLTGPLAGMEPVQLVAFFDPIERIEASPSGGYVTVEPGRILRADGTSFRLPRGLEHAGPLAFAPDERWVAVGTRASVFLVSLAGPERIRLPIRARDLAWR